MKRAWPGLALGLIACAAAPRSDGVSGRAMGRPHAIVISLDGLMPSAILGADAAGLQIPTLRRLARGGRMSPAARSAFPTVTYPNHTGMVTGVAPARHGIVSNTPFDPLEKNKDGWYWYAEDVRVPTLWDVAGKAGRRVALVSWPVTVGAHADVVVPEVWRAGTGDDQKLLRALSTPPGILDETARRFPDLWTGLRPPSSTDASLTDVAVHVLETRRPDLLMLHIFGIDDAQHAAGPGSPEAARAIENADAQVARVIAAARAAGTWDSTLLVVVSDHGFLPVTRAVRPGAYLREAGLVTVAEGGKVTGWRAAVAVTGGAAFVHLAETADEELRRTVMALFTDLAGRPGSGIGRVYTAAELARMGADPTAFLGIEAAAGTTFLAGSAGPVEEPTATRGSHGYDPERPELRATFLLAGPAVTPGVLPEVRLVHVAPTVAAWLGLTMAGLEGVSRL